MTTELTQPQPELEPAPVNGSNPGQSQGHRRRRRRRKSKSNQPNPAPQQQQATAPVPPVQAQTAPPKQFGFQGQGHSRKKKKQFQKSAPPPPGNSLAPPPQSKRKNRQKGPREFVGPMDHSYRAVNGNVADSPPATIPVGNGAGAAYYPEMYTSFAPVPVRTDAPTRIFCFIEDLFFQAKINETARKLGVKVEFVKGGADKEILTRLTELPEEERPRLLVFDLNNLNAKPISLIPKFKSKFKKATSIVGFLNHLQGELKAKAVEAGCDTVMPRSAFSQSLPNMLRRYGIEDEDDNYPQPM